jgi:UDP-4-amino-4,6-dideoxy-N-acetyl-beta-L-altrosamine transaminase
MRERPALSTHSTLSVTAEDTKPAFLPYGRQVIEQDDIDAVAKALSGDFLTTGPLLTAFEQALSSRTGAVDTIACSSGTSALYIATRALGLGQGHTVIVPAITFAATASAPHLAGAEVVFADVDPESGLMRGSDLEMALKRCPHGSADAVFAVHYAGQSCDMETIADLARSHGMRIVEDAAHALGTAWIASNGALIPVGANAHSDLTTFSFHPVKTVAMGEGGAVSANDPRLIRRLRRARNHGIVREASECVRPRAAFDSEGLANPWYYEVEDPSFNFRISDINCALGLSQLKKLGRFADARRRIVAFYDAALAPLAPLVYPLKREPRSHTVWHIYPVRIDFPNLRRERGPLMRALSAEGIGTQVHYTPLHRQPYYAARYKTPALPGAKAYYASTLTLPLHAGMKETDAERVVTALKRHLGL